VSHDKQHVPPAAALRCLVIALWFGVATGLLEVAIIAIRHAFFQPILEVSRDYLWMTPLAASLVTLVPGLFLSAASWLTGRNCVVSAIFVGAWVALLNLILYVPGLSRLAAIVLAAGLAASLTRGVASRLDGFILLVRKSLLWLVAIVAVMGVSERGWRATAAARAQSQLPAAATDAPNVLVITLDAVRAANLSLYGYQRPTTPRLAQFAATGVVFDRAISTCPWTLPSHASMFTGRWHHELSADYEVPLDAAFPVLAETFARRGYATGGFVANMRYCGYESGLNRGFVHYRDYRVSLGQIASSSKLCRTILNNFRLRHLVKNDEHLNRKHASVLNREFFNWLSRNESRPFFAFLNYFDAHEPYLPPAPFDTRFGPARARGKHSPLHHWLWNPALGHGDLSQATVDEERAAYDGAIAYLDEQLGVLLDELRSRQRLERTLIVITSDHGEEFGEHRVYDHGNSLYYPSVHVPLVISFPQVVPPGKRVESFVSLRDLPATIRDLLDWNDEAAYPGDSLVRYWDQSVSDKDEDLTVLSEVNHARGHPDWFPISRGDMRAIVFRGMRYIKNGDGKAELYDVRTDPWEQRDLAGDAEYAATLDEGERRLKRMVPP
jgi:arylsulfatase A-like enzyme